MRSMKRFKTIAAFVVFGALVSMSAGAQIPQEFTNLELLPEDISRADLINTMRGFSEQLGVRCNFCHVGEDQTSAFSDFDFASDEKGHKRITRIMMAMTRAINETYLSEVKGHGNTQVTCATCHHGQSSPSTLSRQLLEAFDKGGTDQLTARYGELRDELYGRGVYDFGEASLIGVATIFARERKDPEAAEAVLELNLEHFPDSFMTWYSMGELKSMAQDNAGALAAFQKALEIDPQNEWAKKAVDRLKQ